MNAALLKSMVFRENKTMAGLAEELNCSRQSLNTRLNGQTEFKLSEMRKIEKYLNLSNQEVQDIFFS